MKNMWLLNNNFIKDIQSEDDFFEKDKFRNYSPCRCWQNYCN